MVFPFVSQTPRPFLVSLNPPDLAALKALIGNSQVTAVIDRVFPLSECSQAIEDVGGGHVRGKVVIGI
jgi:NADPH:quinone reductase-like Zn-dependent oxidoreductase